MFSKITAGVVSEKLYSLNSEVKAITFDFFEFQVIWKANKPGNQTSHGLEVHSDYFFLFFFIVNLVSGFLYILFTNTMICG